VDGLNAALHYLYAKKLEMLSMEAPQPRIHRIFTTEDKKKMVFLWDYNGIMLVVLVHRLANLLYNNNSLWRI